MSCHFSKARILFKNNVLSWTKYYSTATNIKTVSKIYETAEAKEPVEIKGWVKSLRKLKEVTFFDVSDGSSAKKLQVFVPRSLKPDNLTIGASVIVKGSLSTTLSGQLELKADSIEVCGECKLTDGYPFLPKKKYSPEYVRQYIHLRPRTNKFAALLRIRSEATYAIHQHFKSEGYINIHTPVLTSNDCEGAGEVFTVRPECEKTLKGMAKPNVPLDEAYFNTKTYLTVSGQLQLEAVAHGLSKVYTFGPTFRAENSRSRLHLSEFYMIEAETAFVDKLEQLTQMVEKLIKNVTENVLNSANDDIKCCEENTTTEDWIHKSFPVITYNECVCILNENQGKYNGLFNEKAGFTKEHEMFLVKYCGNVPTFVINWPKSMKPFYTRECESDPTKVSALDLLAPGVGEIVGGSLRENDYNKLKHKLPQSNSLLDWYLELRKYGGVPTGGFGLGFERYLQLIVGINNIKDVIPFPRWPHNCSL